MSPSFHRDERLQEPKKKKILRYVLVAVLGALIALGGVTWLRTRDREPQQPAVRTVSKASLLKAIEIGDLTSIEYFYNSVAKVTEGSDLKYYVAYEGTVRLGVAFADIRVDVDDDQKQIVISVPKVRVQDYVVNAGSMDFIFANRKFETETVAAEGYSACLADLKTSAESDAGLFEQAQENLEGVLRKMTEPWLLAADADYTLRIERREEG